MTDKMREAMDHVRTDTDDLTGATAPVPTDEELTAAVAVLAAHGGPVAVAARRPPPGWWVIGILAGFILLADVGILMAFRAQENVARAQCERVNTVRLTLIKILVAAEANVPAERYTADTRKFYDDALSGLTPVDCDNPDRRQVEAPVRKPREPGQPTPIAAGETGDQGASGLAGADGKDGKDGAPGVDGKDGTGVDGVDGVDGAPGEVGPAGPAGPPGADAPTTTTIPPLIAIP